MTGLEESVYIVSHGRDNEIHFWDINSVLQESIRRSSSIRIIDLSESTGSRLAMTPILSLPVNALNFCKMAILAVDNDSKDISDTPESATKRESQDATETTTMKTGACVLRKTHRNIFVAVPSPTTSSLIDIYDVTKPERTFAAVGPFDTTPSDFGSANVQPMGSDKKWGSVMSIRLYLSRSTVDDGNNMQARKERLHMLVGYEDGSVTLFQDSNVSSTTTMDDITGSTTRKSKRTMEVIWSMKCHREPVLAVDVSSKAEFAISCGSDNVLVKYNLYSSVQGTPETMKVVLKANGMADGKIRSDQKLIALAGWDGRIRLFSAKTLKPLAVLKYHREGLYCLGFAVIKEQEREEAPSSQLTSSDDKSAAALMTSDLAGSTAPAKDSTADAISKGENDKGTRDSSQSNDGDVGMSSGESSSESEDESALEDAIADRQRWSNRHWIAVGGKEQRISLWDIY
ncbi:ASTRA complex subunit [Linnemannia zychae]|nr:ASTRA complex subunit [Linnemannia zychae]